LYHIKRLTSMINVFTKFTLFKTNVCWYTWHKRETADRNAISSNERSVGNKRSVLNILGPTPLSRVLEKLIVAQPVKKFRAFYGTQRFITVVTSSRHWSICWARWNFLPHFPRSILILFFHLHLDLPNGIFPSGFRVNILYEFLIPHMHVTCPSHFILLDFITIILFGEAYTFRSP